MEENIQVKFAIMQFKIQLLALAKDMVKDKTIDENVRELYLELREEVIGIPNPNDKKEDGK